MIIKGSIHKMHNKIKVHIQYIWSHMGPGFLLLSNNKREYTKKDVSDKLFLVPNSKDTFLAFFWKYLAYLFFNL